VAIAAVVIILGVFLILGVFVVSAILRPSSAHAHRLGIDSVGS
jgi:hypothetical protein